MSEEGLFTKLIIRSQERRQLEMTLSFALHTCGDRTVNRVDVAVITRGHSQRLASCRDGFNGSRCAELAGQRSSQAAPAGQAGLTFL